MFCFHNTVAQSKTFTNGVSPESIGYHLKNYYVDYVSGAMRIKLRDKKMQLFKSNSHSIISNARCLIEGVDVPSVEMVAFISPKKSEIDIVQAIGRALRNVQIQIKNLVIYMFQSLLINTESKNVRSD